jgi:hypothetical protein
MPILWQDEAEPVSLYDLADAGIGYAIANHPTIVDLAKVKSLKL